MFPSSFSLLAKQEDFGDEHPEFESKARKHKILVLVSMNPDLTIYGKNYGLTGAGRALVRPRGACRVAEASGAALAASGAAVWQRGAQARLRRWRP